MNTRRWLAVILVVVVVGGAVTLSMLPRIVRHVAIARIEAASGRKADIDTVELRLLSGRFTIRGFRLAERDGTTPFVVLPQVEGRFSLASLLRGHVWIRELAVSDPSVRIVRLPGNELNISDLIQTSGTTGKPLDVTVDHFSLARGTVVLDDQALPESRTWTSEQMTIEARNLSTRRNDGTAVARSVTAGAPVALDIRNLRLYPIHLDATATVQGLDLTPARVYVPPDAPFQLDRGRVTTTVTVSLDARDGIRADATGGVEDVVLVEAGSSEVVARMPKMTGQLTGFGLREGSFRVDRLVVDGTMTVRDPTPSARGAFRASTVRASIADLTWPATTPGRLDVQGTIPGGGTLSLVGTVRPPPAATQLNVRIANLDLAPWAQFVPVAARVTGIASADLRMNEPFAAGIPARVQGTVAVTRLGVADGRDELLRAQRVEASGLEIHWPTRVVVRRLLVNAPHALVERDRAGEIPAFRLMGGLGGASGTPPTSNNGGSPTPPIPSNGAPRTPPIPNNGLPPNSNIAALTLDLREVVVRDGAVAWRDATVTPAAKLDVSAIDANVTGAGWPLKAPLNVRVALRPPGGGQMQVTGRVGVDPLAADVRVITKNAELAPYQPYLPTTARVSGAADLDLAVVVPSLAERRATARGTATLSRVDVRDGQRTVMRAERVAASGVDVAWPERIAVGRLALARPWLLLERDDKGALALRALLPPGSTGNGSEAVAISVAQLAADDGGMRVVDRAISPAFAVDVDTATVRVDGLTTTPARPAKLDLTARVGGTSELALRGTVGALGGPLRLDLDGEIREFAVPRANSYLVNQVGWKSIGGRVTAKLLGRLDGDALSAKTDIRVSRLQLVRVEGRDEAQTRIGLPLGMITSLMKNSRGDINLSLPVGGRLSDPRFDLRETIWGAVRTVAINAVTLPVSWIGRVKFSADSTIQRIEVDPLPFEPGTATLTAEGQARVLKIKAFLDQVPDVKMALTPVVSLRDREPGLSADAPNAAPAALLGRPPAPAVPDLAARRLEAARTAFKQAGVDTSRLTETKLAERQGAQGEIDLEILQPDSPRPSRVRELMNRLGVKGGDEN